MKKLTLYSGLFLVALLLIPGTTWAGKRVAKAKINDGDVKGSVVIGTIPSGWRAMAYLRGLTDPADAVVCIEPGETAGEGDCIVPVCGLDEPCEVDAYGNLEALVFLTGTDFEDWPDGKSFFIDDLDEGDVSAVVYHNVGDGSSSSVFVVIFP